MRRLNATVSPILLDLIRHLAEKEGLSRGCIAQAVVSLSHLFTKDRDSLKQQYIDNRGYAAAYLQYFLPVNLAKIQLLLGEMAALAKGRRVSVLDVGAGPGTGALAVLDWWHRCKQVGELSIVSIDDSPVALRQADQLWRAYCNAEMITTAKLQTYEADVRRSAWLVRLKEQAPFDLIILANCLNEVYGDLKDPIVARTGLVTDLLALLAPHGTMMIVEPALRETSRGLHQVRNRLLQQKLCTVYSPCLHENECPALIKEDDWCHEERAWEPPVSIQAIDREVGFIKDALKFSYLLLRKDGKTIVERRTDRSRVVSELRKMKGEKRAWLCNEQGRLEIGRLDRLASPRNAAFDDWHRGAIVQIERIVWKEREGKVSAVGRIERDAEVELIRPA